MSDLISREAAIAAMLRYGRHDAECASQFFNSDFIGHGPCDCGLDDAIRALPARITPPSDDVAGMVERLRKAAGMGENHLAAKAADMLTRLSADLAAARAEVERLQTVQPQVAVKPLEWVSHPTAPIWRCDTPFGTYKVFALEPFPSWVFDSATDQKDKLTKRAETAQLAKAAAQADYDARILTALEAKP